MTMASQQPDTQSGEGYEVKKLTGNPRYCRSCEKYKPPRAHHCKQCDRYAQLISLPLLFTNPSSFRCVLRMGTLQSLKLVIPSYTLADHHCPWVNNCIGHFNYGHFIRFLFFVDVACSYHLAMVTRRVFYTMGSRYWDEPSTVELVFMILNYTACVPVTLCVGAFR